MAVCNLISPSLVISPINTATEASSTVKVPRLVTAVPFQAIQPGACAHCLLISARRSRQEEPGR